MQPEQLESYRFRFDHISAEVSRLPRDAAPPLIMLGDAQVQHNPVKELAGNPVLNMGIAGDFVEHPEIGILRRLWLLPLARPCCILIHAGANDLQSGIPHDTLIDSYRRLILAVKSSVPQAKVHVQSLLPVRGRLLKLMGDIAVINVMLDELAATENVLFVDTFSDLQNDDGELAPLYACDEEHLSEDGYEILNSRLEDHFKTGTAY